MPKKWRQSSRREIPSLSLHSNVRQKGTASIVDRGGKRFALLGGVAFQWPRLKAAYQSGQTRKESKKFCHTQLQSDALSKIAKERDNVNLARNGEGKGKALPTHQLGDRFSALRSKKPGWKRVARKRERDEHSGHDALWRARKDCCPRLREETTGLLCRGKEVGKRKKPKEEEQ